MSTAALSAVTTASAGPSDDSDTSDGPSVGTDKTVIEPGPGAGGGSDEEWEAVFNSYNYNYLLNYDLLTYKNPGKMAIDVCWTYEDIQVCTSSLDHFKLQTYDCITETTPELVSTTITAEEYQNESFSTSFDFWFGVNPTTSCLWAGQEQAGICEKLKCDFENRWSDPVATPMPAAETLDSLRRFLAEDVDIDDVGSTLATGAGAAVFLAMAAQILTGNSS